ncbi:DUF6150 family protein [Reichenbachiella ulvae]|uniref:DUF6150 family protein n=1 Tax=Reichenbachiella ulvae TaxID=2980104 RepID=A0ABT3CXS7_9BACT|nr:DUF6150 family protein [Reichenbachiella ulvae]MCV9388417.1 DUF6150 family protein [Reichenbachiella ulvae]
MINIFCFILLLLPFAEDSQHDPCDIYGKVYYETRDPNRAHFRVYIEDSESFADVIVYEEQNQLYADRPGHWATVDKPGFADVFIYIEKNRNMADFSIYYTETESFAGCNR